MNAPYNPASPGVLAEASAPFPSRPIYFAPKAGGQVLISGEGIITGFSVHNTDNTAAHNMSFLDGTDATGLGFAWERLVTFGTDVQAFVSPGLMFRNGIYVVDAQGFTEGAVYVITF